MEFSDICPFHNCLSWKGSLLFENLHSHTYLSLRPLDLWTFMAKFQISKAYQRAILCKWQIENYSSGKFTFFLVSLMSDIHSTRSLLIDTV